MDKIAIRESYGKYLEKLGKDESVFVLDSDLSSATKTQLFAKKYPDRFLNLGITEQNMLGVAAGISTYGKTVFANSFAMFSVGRAYDQLRNTICYPNANVKVVGTHYGLTVGQDGASHQMLEDIALTYSIPNIKVYCPSDDFSTKCVLEQVLNEKGPAYIRISRHQVPKKYLKKDEEEIRSGIVSKGDNIDGIIFATGDMTYIAYEAQEELAKQNIFVRVLDVINIKPLNVEKIIENARCAKKIVSIEDHNVKTGLGSIISNVLNENNVFKKVNKIGVEDKFGQSGKPEELLKCYGITKEKIIGYFNGIN